MKILITNGDLDLYAGTQVVVRDLALELRRQGHQPMAYSHQLGDVASDLRSQGIEVTNDLERLSNGRSRRRAGRRGTRSSRDSVREENGFSRGGARPRFGEKRARKKTRCGRVHRRRRRQFRSRIAEAGWRECDSGNGPKRQIDVILNAVDLERFRPRGPLPVAPQRAAIFSNNASRFTHLPAVRKVCREMGIELEILGRQRGKPIANPEDFLPRYDLVFAKARCALEAMAVGSAVVLCDVAGAGPLVTAANFDGLRPLNFGAGVLANPVEVQQLRREVERYNADDAAAVSRRVR